MRAAVALLMLVGAAAWVACFVDMVGAETPAARTADAAQLLLGVGVLTLMSFLVWPRGA